MKNVPQLTGLTCLNPLFNDQARGTPLNGKIFLARNFLDCAALNAPGVSAVILDAGQIPAVQELQDFIARGMKKSPRALQRDLGRVFFRPQPLRECSRAIMDVFRRVGVNDRTRESVEVAQTSCNLFTGYQPSNWGRFREFKTVSANLGSEPAGQSGMKYLLSPVDDARYERDIAGKKWADVARDHPDLQWGELKPGQVMIHRGGEASPNNPVLVFANPQGPHAAFVMTDSEIPVSPGF